jgi:hypothetical protein
MSRTARSVALSLALALGVSGLAFTVVHAQGDAKKTPGKLMTLTPLDYVEIRQLAARYGHAVDQGTHDGFDYADLFAPGATFGTTTGRDNLATLAKRTAKGPQTAWHFIVNHAIEPTEDGAKGMEYMVHMRYGETGRPNAVWGGGHYEDTYVKTPDGWRFKTRRFVASEGTAGALQPQTTGTR